MKEQKEIKIDIPSGYEIDRENSTFECIKFKKKELTYNDVAKELFKDGAYYVNSYGKIRYLKDTSIEYADCTNGTSDKQLEKLLAINKLMNIAKYLNGGWKPEFDGQPNYHIVNIDGDYSVSIHYNWAAEIVYFKSKEDANRAIKIMGKDLDLIFCTDW